MDACQARSGPGTFSWPGFGPRLLTDLAYAEYAKFAILDVEAPQHITRARSLARWWRGRQEAVRGGDGFGGRFTPGFVIDALYTGDSEETVCACNARAAFDTPCPRRSRRSSCSSSMPTAPRRRG
ncbi:hypothetical protein [Rhodococcus opacus]|uniref:hypothetical protein n=1 Tax=Rhodococcus opacus TaxID=37919 RepID=UPI0022362470|nr:hypothetical protein [Rhodococcus opacus]UZG59688.1 hypothetical protein ONE62_38700 [Rhodococcus opacus]